MSDKAKENKKFNIKNFFRFTESGTRFDMPIFIITLILLAYGLVMLYSASYVVGIYRFQGDSLHYIKDQAFFALIGVGVMLFASKVDYHVFKQYSTILMVITLVLLVVVLFMPEWNGCKRWIRIDGVGTFQPSEIAKFAVILLFAKKIEFNGPKMKKFVDGILGFVIFLVPIVALMFLQPHLSGIIIICAIGAIMMFIGGRDEKYFIIAVVRGIIAIVAVLVFVPDAVKYASARIENWLYPERDLLGGGHQPYQARLAIGSGGLFGLGLGNSRAKHLFLPEPQNDYIFAIICEELGFVGGVMVIILFIALFLRGIYIATHAKDKFGAMLVIGIVTQIALQAFLNVAVATGTIPTTGISLPFFSEGGTSLLMILGEMGIVLSVSRYANLDGGQ